MRKHFLLLFLMALLPLASFAATVTDVDISAKVVAITLQTSTPVYNNQVQTPTITKVVVDGVEYTSELTQFFTPKYYKKNALNNWIPQNADQIQDAGEYAVAIVANGAIDAERELKYTADKESDVAYRATYTIQKKDLNVTLANGTKQYGGTDPTTLGVTPTNLPDGWTAPEFVFNALPRTAGEAVSSTGYAYAFTLDDNAQDDITSVNYNVIITNQPKLIVTKKAITLDYSGTATQPSKVYGVETLNADFLTDIKAVANYSLHTGSALEGSDELATVLAGITADGKVTTAFNYVAGKESANAQPNGTPFAAPAEHKLTITIDESVAGNYEFTVGQIALTVRQAELSAAAPYTFAKAEASSVFTYSAQDKNLTKTVTYTANSELLLADDADPAVTPQVVVTYKVKPLDQATAATLDAADTKAAGIYEAYIAPTDDSGNFYTEGYNPIRVNAFDFTVNKKALYVYVTNDAITEVYKGSAYTLPGSASITFQGLTDADAADATITTAIAAVKAAISENGVATATTTVTNADDYTIIPDVPAASALHTNYAVQTYESTFTVSPLAITIDPKNMPNVVYGTAIAGTAAATVDDNTDPLNPVVGNVTVTKDNELDPDILPADQAIVLSAYNVVVADQTYAAGQTYTGAITLSQIDLDPTVPEQLAILNMLDNFDITEETGDVTIGQGTYSIVVKNKNKTYGDALAWTDFDYLTPGLTGTTKPASVKFILVNTADATETYSQHNGDALPKNFGTYTIKVDAANSDLTIANYTTPSEAASTLIAGELSIAKKALTFTTTKVKVNAGATKAALYTMGASKVTTTALGYEDDEILFDLEYVENAEGTTSATNKIALVGGTGADAKDMKNTTPVDTYAAGYKVVEPADATGYANANYTITWNVTGILEVAGANVLLLSQSADDLMNTLTVADDNTEYDVTLQNVKFNGNATTMKAKKWYSMVLPFKISVAQLSSTLGYAIVNRMDQTTTDGNLHFRLAFDEIPANEPFLVKSVKGEADHLEEAVDINTKTFYGVKITKPADVTVSIQTADASPIVFTGVYEKEHYLATGDKLYNGSDNDIPVRVSKDNYSYLNPFRSYWTAPAAARIFVEDLNEDGTTAIKEINAQMEEIATDGWYTVNGIKLQGAPTEKGIYIHNGKKIVLK